MQNTIPVLSLLCQKLSFSLFVQHFIGFQKPILRIVWFFHAFCGKCLSQDKFTIGCKKWRWTKVTFLLTSFLGPTFKLYNSFLKVSSMNKCWMLMIVVLLSDWAEARRWPEPSCRADSNHQRQPRCHLAGQYTPQIYHLYYRVYPIRSTAPNRRKPPFLTAMCPWQNHWNCFTLQLNTLHFVRTCFNKSYNTENL